LPSPLAILKRGTSVWPSQQPRRQVELPQQHAAHQIGHPELLQDVLLTTRELAFAGNALESLGSGFDAVLRLPILKGQQSHNSVLARGSRHPELAGCETYELADLESVLGHGQISTLNESSNAHVTRLQAGGTPDQPASGVASSFKQCNEAVELLVDLAEMIGDIFCRIRYSAIDLAESVRRWLRQEIIIHPLSDSVLQFLIHGYSSWPNHNVRSEPSLPAHSMPVCSRRRLDNNV
jgi:hypothetical protein